ncbi:HAMP domain-containing histidine kinase [candidate division KSB1 bacterium]|nr:HAMP domain-containing histidine kinase [candidate division KSB1 bacterium]
MPPDLPFPFRAFLALWLITTISLVALRWEPRPLPYRFEGVRRWENSTTVKVQIGLFQPHPDSAKYGVTWTSEYQIAEGRWLTYLEWHDTSGAVVLVRNARLPIERLTQADADGDGIDDILVAYGARDSSGLVCWKWPGLVELWRHDLLQPPELRGQHVWDAGVTSCQILPASNGLPTRLICCVRSAYGLQPRGLIALDARTGGELWSYWTAAPPGDPDTCDVDRDGAPEILIGSYAPTNGARYQGCSDDSCFLALLDGAGRQLWRRSWPPPFPGITAKFTRTAGGECGLLALRTSGVTSGPPNTLYRLDPRSGATLDSTVFSGIGGGYALTPRFVRRDSVSGFLVYHNESEMAVHSESGAFVSAVGPYLAIVAQTDLNLDGGCELIARSHQSTTFVLDSSFRVVAQSPVHVSQYHEQFVSADRAVLWLADDRGVSLTHYEHNPDYARWWMRRIVWGLAWIAIGLVTALIITLVGFQYRRIQEQKREADAKARRLAELMAVVRHIGHQQGAPLQEFGDRLSELEYQSKSVTVDLLGEIISTRADFEQLKRRLTDTIRSIRKYVNAELLTRHAVDLAAFVRTELGSRNGTSRASWIELDIEPGIQLVDADAGQLQVLLEMLLDNGMKALAGLRDRKPQITVRVYSMTETSRSSGTKTWVHLDFSDNGEGIAPENLEHVFKLGFTTRAEVGGTGFGLAFVHKTVLDHDGEIWIESERGHGTIFHLRFPRI